jgi:cobalamin biosynthesis protein CobD/CbiB
VIILPIVATDRGAAIGIIAILAMLVIVTACLGCWLLTAALLPLCTMSVALLLAIDRSEIEGWLDTLLADAAREDLETAAALGSFPSRDTVRMSLIRYNRIATGHNERQRGRLRASALELRRENRSKGRLN